MRIVVFVVALFGFHANAHAYIGPGLGAGAIAIVLGFIGSIILAVFALLYYPIKRILKKKPKKTENQQDN